LINGVPTVAPGTIGVASIVAAALTDSYGYTDENGNCTLTVTANLGGTVGVTADAWTYWAGTQGITVSGESGSVDIVLLDNTYYTALRCPLFDGTGSGVVDNEGNQYRYVGRGEYYMTTASGQIDGTPGQLFLPTGVNIYVSYGLQIGCYPGDPNFEYDPGGSGFVFEHTTEPYTQVYYQQVSPGYYMSASGAFFMPLP